MVLEIKMALTLLHSILLLLPKLSLLKYLQPTINSILFPVLLCKLEVIAYGKRCFVLGLVGYDHSVFMYANYHRVVVEEYCNILISSFKMYSTILQPRNIIHLLWRLYCNNKWHISIVRELLLWWVFLTTGLCIQANILMFPRFLDLDMVNLPR